MRAVWKAFYWYIMVCVLVLMAAGVFGSGCQGMVKTEKAFVDSAGKEVKTMGGIVVVQEK